MNRSSGSRGIAAWGQETNAPPREALVLLVGMLVAGCLVAARPAAAQRCDCDVGASAVVEYDALLLAARERTDALVAFHLPWGLPSGPAQTAGETVLVQDEFVLAFDADLGTATWAAYRLTADDLAVDRNRTECFRVDVRLGPPLSPGCDDYAGSGFDRGHFVPSDDMARSEAAMVNTFTFANMSPQYASFNRVIWKRLETYVRRWATAYGSVYVITGAIFDRDRDGSRDPDDGSMVTRIGPAGRVVVPTDYFKILVRSSDAGLETLTLVLPHVDKSITGVHADPYLATWIRTIDDVEALTGVDFFAELADDRESELEAARAGALWSR